MNNFYLKSVGFLFAVLLSVNIISAQPGCPAVDAGSNVSLPCGTNCTNLSATTFPSGNTTSYSVAPIAYTPFSYTAGTSILVNIDDIWSDVINLPFTFCFFGNAYNQVVVGANGLITFDVAEANLGCVWDITAAGTLPTSNIYGNCIMGPYHDIDPSLGGDIKYQIIGSAPCRIFIVSYSQVPMYNSDNFLSSCSGMDATHQIAIYETTNAIEVYIEHKDACPDGGIFSPGWNGGLAIEGIQNAGQTVAYTVPNRNNSVWTANNDAWRFTPNGPSIVTVDWFNGATQIGTGSTISVCPGSNTTYTAQATYLPCSGGTPVVVTDNVTVSLAGSLQAAIDSVHNVSCFGANDGVAYAHATTANAGLSYGWANGPNTLTYSNLAPGTYIFTATDASACVRSDTIIITQPAQLTANVPDASQTNCAGAGTGTLVATSGGGTGPNTFIWNSNPAQNDSILDNVTAGTYSVTVSDSRGCTATASGTLTITAGGNNVALSNPVITNVSCFGGADGSITASATGGSGVYNYNWNGGPATAANPNLVAGAYTVTVDDGAGCTASGTYNVTQPTQLTLNAPAITNIGCGGGTGSITANPTGGTTSYAYAWSQQSNSQTYTGQTITGLSADNYNLTVTDAHACTVTAAYTVTVAPSLAFTQSQTNASCFGSSDGSATITVTGGTPPYQYNWNANGPTANATLSGLAAGTADVTITDANCTATATFTITEPTQVVIAQVSQTNVSCGGGSDGTITVSAAGGGNQAYNYAWNTNPVQTGATASNLPAGSVTVVATDINLCTASATYTITEPTPVTVSLVSLTGVSCAGGSDGSITVLAAGGSGAGYNYAWNTTPAQMGATASNLPAGTFTVVAADANLCSVSANFTVTEPAALVVDSVSIVNVSCSGAPGSLTAHISGGTGSYTYTWAQQSNSQVYSGQLITGLQADTYGLLVTDANSCTITGAYTVNADVPLAFTQTQTEVSCFGGNNGSATVTITSGTPPYMYLWSATTVGGSSTINGLAAGVSDVTITDADCSATATFNITQPTQVVVSLVSQTDIACAGGNNGTIEVAASGGTGAYSYAWNSTPAQNGAIATNLPAATYTVVASDANACTATGTYSLSEPAILSIELDSIDATCFNAPNGSVVASVNGGTTPYAYQWSDPDNQTTKNAMGLLAGPYTCVVTDANGCIISGSSSVQQPDDMLISPPVVTAVKCIGDKNGTIMVDAQGGTSPFNYSATQDGANFVFATNNVIMGLAIGTYTVIVADDNGCTKTVFATVPNATIDNFTTSTDSTKCYGPSYTDGSASIQPTPNSYGNGPFQYQIDGGLLQFSNDFYGLGAGPHIITVINGNGCISEVPVIVAEPLPIVVDVVPDTVILPLGEGEQVMVTYINAPGEVTYSWTPELGLSCIDCPNPMVSPFTQQDYVITISMVNGSATCYGSATLHADVLDPLPVFIPNSFTPNGDGNNDVFQLFGQSIKTVDLRIFNRWGELVYKTNNQFSGWDGTYKGQMQLPQVFTYAVKIVFLDDKKVDRKGTVTLLR